MGGALAPQGGPVGEREAEGAAVPETAGAPGEGAQEGGLPPVGFLWLEI